MRNIQELLLSEKWKQSLYLIKNSKHLQKTLYELKEVLWDENFPTIDELNNIQEDILILYKQLDWIVNNYKNLDKNSMLYSKIEEANKLMDDIMQVQKFIQSINSSSDKFSNKKQIWNNRLDEIHTTLEELLQMPLLDQLKDFDEYGTNILKLENEKDSLSKALQKVEDLWKKEENISSVDDIESHKSITDTSVDAVEGGEMTDEDNKIATFVYKYIKTKKHNWDMIKDLELPHDDILSYSMEEYKVLYNKIKEHEEIKKIVWEYLKQYKVNGEILKKMKISDLSLLSIQQYKELHDYFIQELERRKTLLQDNEKYHKELYWIYTEINNWGKSFVRYYDNWNKPIFRTDFAEFTILKSGTAYWLKEISRKEITAYVRKDFNDWDKISKISKDKLYSLFKEANWLIKEIQKLSDNMKNLGIRERITDDRVYLWRSLSHDYDDLVQWLDYYDNRRDEHNSSLYGEKSHRRMTKNGIEQVQYLLDRPEDYSNSN